MNREKLHLTALIFSLFLVFTTHEISSQVPGKLDPEKFFGFRPGSDGNLFSYDQLISYYKALDEASGKVKMMETGQSPMGRKMYVVFISSEDNIKNLDKLKSVNKQLALDATLSEKGRNNLIKEGKVFMMVTLSMHSTEVGPAQASPLTAWHLITSGDPTVETILKNVVLMVVPTHNPDGMEMVVDYYKKVKGTKYEKSDFPGIYHKYLGHDNNRDYNNLTQDDSKAVSGLQSTEWYPQVFNDKHQMGMTGPRYFVPPYHDPIAENVDPEMWNWVGLFGSNLIKNMTEDSLAGVSHNYSFDNYWPGSTKTCLWKNIITFLTECASCYIATPAFVEPTELTVGGKGLAEYKMSTNMPKPWPGGWWRLGDIVKYEISSTLSALTTAASHRAEILKFRNVMCRRQVEAGKNSPPYYYILPQKQHDQSELSSLVRLMQEHGVEVYQLKSRHQIENTVYNVGDVVIPMAQPYRAFIKEVMEKQVYPERHYSIGGPLIKPYDITSWSFPLHRGLVSFEMNDRLPDIENDLKAIPVNFRLSNPVPRTFGYAVLPAGNNESYELLFAALGQKMKVQRTTSDWNKGNTMIPAGSFVLEKSQALVQMLESSDFSILYVDEKPGTKLEEIRMPRIALMETWFEDVDAGWTRYVLDSYHVPFTVLRPGDVKTTDLKSKYDVLMIPGNDKNVLMEGKFKGESGATVLSEFPPEYNKGLTFEGFNKILTFLNEGGLVISWGESTSLFTGALTIKKSDSDPEEFQLPFNNVGESLVKAGLYAPGDLVRIELLKGHPLTYGMQENANIFYRGRTAFTTSLPVFDTDRRVIAKFPDDNVLQSGYIEKPELLKGKSAMVWVKKGEGQLVLLAFSPAFRASTQGAYKLLFNSILLK
jgi:hypothetical protein